jgi:hypothetical protein
MYVTAHLVRSPGGDEGINGWIHEHGSIPWPTSLPDILKLVETNPGEPLRESLGLCPVGGNSVLAYLDVLAPDGTPRADIVAALDHLYRLPPDQAPVAVLVDGVIAVRMSSRFGRRDEWADDVEELSRVVENLLRQDTRLRVGRPLSATATSGSR